MTTLPRGLVPADEDARIAAVRRYDVLDTPPDGAFDRITALAARVCGTPISTITIVDTDRIWFKSAFGIEVDEVGRDPGLCASAILGELPHVVTDAATDPRTLENPLVRGELGLRFYAGVPLRTHDGYNLGTLNIIDVAPRELEPEQLRSLQDLAAVVMDEMELRLASRRAVEVEATREALRLRDSIIAGISHEMRTPLGILHGILEVEQGAIDDTGEQAPQLVETHAMMRRQVRHLDWLLKQFLDYASLESDRPPVVEPERTELVALITEAIEVFADRAPITLHPASGTIVAMVDRDRTWQICLELLNNATRFSPADTPIEVSVGWEDDEHVQLVVTDHGTGILPESLERLFDPTYRHSDSTGSGVGLYVSRAFAEAQGGRLEVRSVPGDGSSFTLVLPAAR